MEADVDSCPYYDILSIVVFSFLFFFFSSLHIPWLNFLGDNFIHLHINKMR